MVKMYSEKVTFTPNNVYIDLNFKDIKEYLKVSLNPQFKDLGNIIIFRNSDILITVNDIGQVNILYNHLQDQEIADIAETIQNSFRKYAGNFRIEQQIETVH